MNTLLMRVLRQHGLISDDHVPPMTMLLSGQAVYQVFVEHGVTLFAKLTHPPALAQAQGWMTLDLKKEHHGLQRAGELLPGHVPVPLLLHEQDGWQILVTRGIAHDPATYKSLQAPSSATAEGLYEFYSRVHKQDSCDGEGTHRTYLSRIVDRHAHIDAIARQASWLDSPQSVWVDSLPHVPQHCDFSANNIGRANGKLIFFDWEDYGKVSVPGLDLCTFLISAIGTNADALTALFRGERYEALMTLVTRVCKLYGMSTEAFARMLPVYLAVCLELKRGRDPERLDALAELANHLPEQH